MIPAIIICSAIIWVCILFRFKDAKIRKKGKTSEKPEFSSLNFYF